MQYPIAWNSVLDIDLLTIAMYKRFILLDYSIDFNDRRIPDMFKTIFFSRTILRGKHISSMSLGIIFVSCLLFHCISNNVRIVESRMIHQGLQLRNPLSRKNTKPTTAFIPSLTFSRRLPSSQSKRILKCISKSRLYYSGDNQGQQFSFDGKHERKVKDDRTTRDGHLQSKVVSQEVEEIHQNKKLDLQLLLLDNYDSYTYNLYSYLCTLCKHKPIVVSNDAYDSWDDLIKGLNVNNLDGIIISPGPGRPENKQDMGVCIEAIKNNPNIPILGVCLGHQAIGHYYNASVTLAPSGPVHGLTSKVWYTPFSYDNLSIQKDDRKQEKTKCDLFQGIHQSFDVVRYHSLVVQFPESNELDIEPTAWCCDGVPQHSEVISTNGQFDLQNRTHNSVCMALQHKYYPHYGVQFHPESVGTGEVGYRILQNFCNFCADWRSKLPRPMNISGNKKGAMNLSMNEYTGCSTSAARPLSSKYNVLIHKIDHGSEDLPLPDQVFEELYSSLNTTFWLDSSTGRRNADVESVMTMEEENDSCPIISNSRFSIIGSNDGPLSKVIEYWGNEHPKSLRGVFVSEMKQDEATVIKLDTDILSYLQDELKTYCIIDNVIHQINLNDEGYQQRILEDSYLPFQYRGGYVGYLGYEVRHDTRASICKHEVCNLSESVDEGKDQTFSNPNVPTAAFVFADRSLLYDHWRGDWYCVGIACNEQDNEHNSSVNTMNESAKSVIEWMRLVTKKINQITFQSDSRGCHSKEISLEIPLDFLLARPKDQYINDIARCHDEIKNGESYELCLTNQLQTQVSIPKSNNMKSSPFGLYNILRQKNPAPFSAFLNFDHVQPTLEPISICCSSPERFLSISKQKACERKLKTQETHGWEFAPPFELDNDNDFLFTVETKPIKGTIKRKINGQNGIPVDDIEDYMIAESLRTSVKNRAENLMIVDLLRNDLSRVCEPGSVHVPKLMAIESFATVHQMVSTIRGIVRPDQSAVDVIAACFPGGSMTGAPKLRSIDLLNEMEERRSRGPYSGCLGYISLNGCMDMNIIIRTALLSKGHNSSKSDVWDITIGAGGAITALSESEDEFDEMLLKSRAVRDAVHKWFNDNSVL